ncbi:MAG: trigger factor [Thermodesulfobacteriota bacterium]
MNVQVEEISSVKRKLHIVVPAEVVTDEFDRAYRELKRTARVKGFRPGKAPRSLLERFYGDLVRREVIGKIVEETYSKSLEENGLQPVSRPEIEGEDIRAGEDFSYTVVVEVKPQIHVSGYLGLELVREDPQVTEEQVQARLEEIREMFARLENVEEDRPVQEGDFVLIEQTMLMEGRDAPDKRVPEERMLEVKPGQGDEALIKALIGLRVGGQGEVPQCFPPDHRDSGLAGREGVLGFVLKAIRKKVLPDLDDAFAQRLGEYQTLEEFKARVRQEVEEEERRRIRSSMNQAIIDQLLEKHDFEVPEAMVEWQIQAMIRNVGRRLAVHGLTMEQAAGGPGEMRARFRDPAVRAVRTTLILEAIARQEGIEVSEDEMEEAFRSISLQTGRSIQQVREMYEDPDALAPLRASVLEDKALDFVRERAKMLDKDAAREA